MVDPSGSPLEPQKGLTSGAKTVLGLRVTLGLMANQNRAQPNKQFPQAEGNPPGI